MAPNMSKNVKISLEEYLEEVARFCENEYSNMFRGRFQDMEGNCELAMLAAPTAAELKELRRAVAIMTAAEKHDADKLTDEQVERIAEDAKVDPANLAIFVNGYNLMCKRVS